MAKVFEDEFMDIQTEIISLANEYILGQADKIYVYGIIESLLSVDIFYEIHGQVIGRYYVNNALSEEDQWIDVDGRQSALLQLSMDEIKNLRACCESYDRECPSEFWLVYDVKTKSFDGKYSYEWRYRKADETQISPNSELKKWMEEIKADPNHDVHWEKNGDE